MKRPRHRRDENCRTECDCEGDSTSRYTDSDERSDATVETDLTEPDPPRRPAKKRLKADETRPAPELSSHDDAGDFSDDPLDDTGGNLSDIPEDFDKADGTILRRERIEVRWNRYCKVKAREEPEVLKWRKPEEALCQASNNDMYRFLGWCLKLQRGKGGRRLKGIHKSSSLETDWKNFRGYYQRVTGIKINDDNGSKVRRGIKFLVKENGLDTQPKKKTPVYIEDMTSFNETILSTQEKRFDLGFQRIQVCLFNTLGLFTLHRKGALLGLQFKHLQVSLQKDPRGGPPIPLIELSTDATKKFLGLTKLFGSCLFTNCQQMVLPLKHDVADWYIFCKTEMVNGVPVIQRTKPISDSTMSAMLTTFSEIHGWLLPFFAHQFRYGSGKILNESGWVSEEQLMLIMKHADRRTFLNHYHPLQIDTDMIRTLCGLDPDVELMRAVTRQSRWMDKRRPRHLTNEEKARIKDHPELEEACRKLNEVRAKYEHTQSPDLLFQIQRREKDVKNTRKRLLSALRNQIRQEFDEKQAFLDIDAQLSGNAVMDESEDESPSEDDMHPLQLRLVQKLLTYPTSDSLEDEWKRRDEGVEAVTQYCNVLEGGPLRGRPKQTTSKSVASNGGVRQDPPAKEDQTRRDEEPHVPARDELLRATEEHIKTAPKPRACFQCFADEKQPDDVRCKMFHDHGCLTRHFDARHLKQAPIKCNWCEVSLLHTMHLQRHAKDVHRVHSRSRPPS